MSANEFIELGIVPFSFLIPPISSCRTMAGLSSEHVEMNNTPSLRKKKLDAMVRQDGRTKDRKWKQRFAFPANTGTTVLLTGTGTFEGFARKRNWVCGCWCSSKEGAEIRGEYDAVAVKKFSPYKTSIWWRTQCTRSMPPAAQASLPQHNLHFFLNNKNSLWRKQKLSLQLFLGTTFGTI